MKNFSASRSHLHGYVSLERCVKGFLDLLRKLDPFPFSELSVKSDSRLLASAVLFIIRNQYSKGLLEGEVY